MNQDILKILSDSGIISEQQLIDYLQGKLSEKEKHEVEKLMAETEFTMDALEGLEQFEDIEALPAKVDQLNQHLYFHLKKKKGRKKRKHFNELKWIILAIIILLMLVALGYLVIHRSLHP